MTRRYDALDQMRRRASALIADNALLLGRSPTGEPEPGAAAPVEVALDDGAIAWLRGLMRASGADRRFDRTISGITGGQFTPPELRELEDRGLRKAQWPDVWKLRGIEEGPPVFMTPGQKRVTDGLIQGLGADDLAKRARGAYEGAVRAGQVRVR